MSFRSSAAAILLIAPVSLSLFGCAVATDLINPGFLSALGFDPQSIIPASGTVVVAFVNDTSTTARFYAYALEDTPNPTDARNLVVDVEGNWARFRVLECPIGFFAPGSFVDGVVVQLALQSTTSGGEAVELNWEGDVLVEGSDFQCGDVIELRYSTDAGLVVTVRPGR